MGCSEVAVWAARGLVVVAVSLVALAMVVARRRGATGQRSVAAAMVLVVAHPGIWMSPGLVDCGDALLKRSLVFTGLVGLTAAWTVLRPPGPPQGAEPMP